MVSTPRYCTWMFKRQSPCLKANVPILGMIENMSYWTCPDCGRVDHIFGKDGANLEAQKKIQLLGKIPLSFDLRKRFRCANNDCRPKVFANRNVYEYN